MPSHETTQADHFQAWRIYYAALRVAGANRLFPRPGLLSVPPRWTAWLLMDKAGMPRELIALCSREERQEIDAKLYFTRWLMISPIYAAKVEAYMHEMPLYVDDHMPAMEGTCSVS